MPKFYLKFGVLLVLVSCVLIDGVCWTSVNDQHSWYGAEFSNITTVDECLSLCLSQPSCSAIDWDPNNGNLHCYLFNAIGPIGESPGVTHYMLNRTADCSGVQPSHTPAPVSPVTVVPSALSSTTMSPTTTTTSSPPWSVTIRTDSAASLPTPTPSAASTKSSTTSQSTISSTSPSSSSSSTTTILPMNNSNSSSTSPATTTHSTTTTTTTTTAAPERSSEGTSFIIAFPPELLTSSSSSLQLTVCTSSLDDVTVDVLSRDDNTTFYNSSTVSLAACKVVYIPNSLQLSLTDTMASKYLTVIASNRITVQVSVFGSCASYTSLPESLLGTDYYISTLRPTGTDRSILVVTGVEDNTDVTFTIYTTGPSPGSVKLDNGTEMSIMSPPRNFTARLNRGQSYKITSATSDLSGSSVHSLKPVSVVAGNINASSGSSFNFALTQFPPTSLWGKMSVAATLPNTTYKLKVISSQAQMNFTIDNDATAITTVNHVYEITAPGARPTVVSSMERILVVQYSVSVPAAIVLPVVENYRQNYSFMLPQRSSLFYYALLLSQSAVNITLRNQTVDQTLSITSLTNSASYLDGYFPIADYKSSYILFSNNKSAQFGAYIFAISPADNCAIGYSLAYTTQLQDTLLPSTRSGSTFKAQAIRPAYIVLAGLGAADVLLVIIAIVIICSYPIRTTTKTVTKEKKVTIKKSHVAGTGGAVAVESAEEQEMNETSHTAGIETNPYYEHMTENETNHENHHYKQDGDGDDHSGKVEDNPYFNSSDIPKSYEDHDSSGYNYTTGPDEPYNCSADATAAL